jgi:hypothetical protein
VAQKAPIAAFMHAPSCFQSDICRLHACSLPASTVAIEEPFSMMPLDHLCDELEAALLDSLEQAASAQLAGREAATVAAAALAEATPAHGAAATQSSADNPSAAEAALASNVAPFGLGRAGHGRHKRRPARAAAIFASLDDEEEDS